MDRVGMVALLLIPHSEVAMHMRVAGTVMRGQLLDNHMVQLYADDGRPFSFPIGAGEAGWYIQHWTFESVNAALEGLALSPIQNGQPHTLVKVGITNPATLYVDEVNL
jgi:hypothetical protein